MTVDEKVRLLCEAERLRPRADAGDPAAAERLRQITATLDLESVLDSGAGAGPQPGWGPWWGGG